MKLQTSTALHFTELFITFMRGRALHAGSLRHRPAPGLRRQGLRQRLPQGDLRRRHLGEDLEGDHRRHHGRRRPQAVGYRLRARLRDRRRLRVPRAQCL